MQKIVKTRQIMEVELTESNPMKKRNTNEEEDINTDEEPEFETNIQTITETISIICNHYPRLKKCTYYCIFAWIVTIVVMIICSFKYVSELQYCIKYNTVTRAIDDTLYNNGEPGTYFLGIDNDFICYPKTRQRLIYTNSYDAEAEAREKDTFDPAVGNSKKYPSLEARTREGLPMRMDVTVEYKLDGSKITELFELVGQDSRKPLQIVIFSALQNEASKHDATKFLGSERSEVAEKMKIAANESATKFFAEVLQVHLFHIDLPDRFETIIQEIQNIRLDQQSQLELRKFSLLTEKNKFLESKLNLEADAAGKLIDMSKKINEAMVQQVGDITSGRTAAIILKEQLIRDRELALVEVNERLELSKKFRIGNVTEANNRKKEAIISLQKELLEADANAKIMRINAAAKAIEILNLGKADAKSIEYKESARLEMYKTLSTAANMTVEEIMQYDWITSSSKASDGNDVFIDYKKVPLQMENDEL